MPFRLAHGDFGAYRVGEGGNSDGHGLRQLPRVRCDGRAEPRGRGEVDSRSRVGRSCCRHGHEGSAGSVSGRGRGLAALPVRTGIRAGHLPGVRQLAATRPFAAARDRLLRATRQRQDGAAGLVAEGSRFIPRSGRDSARPRGDSHRGEARRTPAALRLVATPHPERNLGLRDQMAPGQGPSSAVGRGARCAGEEGAVGAVARRGPHPG